MTGENGCRPDLRELVDAGYVERIPDEPYGGRFYLKDGKVLRRRRPATEMTGVRPRRGNPSTEPNVRKHMPMCRLTRASIDL